MSVVGTLTKYALMQSVIATIQVTAKHVGAAAGNELGKAAVKKGTKAFKEKILKQEPEVENKYQTGNPVFDVALSAILNKVSAKKENAQQPYDDEIIIEGTATVVNSEPVQSFEEKASNAAENIGQTVSNASNDAVNTARNIKNSFVKGFKK